MGGKVQRRAAQEVVELAAQDEAAGNGMVEDEASSAGFVELIDRARKSLMLAIPDSADALAQEARKGSVQHIKLLLQLVGLDEGGLALKEVRPREKTLEEIVMEQWAKEP